MHLLKRLAGVAAAVTLLSCATAPAAPPAAIAEAPAIVEPFVIAANPLAANAGLEVL